MILALELIAAVLVIVILAVGVLRYRKLRRDHVRGDTLKSTRLISPPPSPYATSKGFRLVKDPNEAPSDAQRTTPARPRLEPSREYVFGESQAPIYDVEALAQLRHDERWALSRSARRATFTPSFVRKLAVVLLVVLVIAVGAFYYFDHSSSKPNSTSTSTTTTTTRTGMAPPSAQVGAYSSGVVISFNMNART